MDWAPGRRLGDDPRLLHHDGNGKRTILTPPRSPANAVGPLAQALGETSSGTEVAIRIDGRSLHVTFEVDDREHARRIATGVGPVVSTGLLHALWLVPSYVAVPVDAVPPVKAERLRTARGFAFEDQEGFHRLYWPAGRVTAIGVVGRNARRVLDATTIQSPAFRRVALLAARAPRALPELIQRAKSAGVGLGLVDDDAVESVVPAPAALRGVPGVFRWWIAELAYRTWRQERTQPVS